MVKGHLVCYSFWKSETDYTFSRLYILPYRMHDRLCSYLYSFKPFGISKSKGGEDKKEAICTK